MLTCVACRNSDLRVIVKAGKGGETCSVKTLKLFAGKRAFPRRSWQNYCTVSGSFKWFRGHEEVFCGGKKTYECYFHGGEVR
jgi:hypothetical protein